MQQAGAAASLAVIGMWRHRGLITPRGHRGRSPLYRLADLLEVEHATRVRVQTGGGRARHPHPETRHAAA